MFLAGVATAVIGVLVWSKVKVYEHDGAALIGAMKEGQK